MITDDLQDRAALYILGSLSADETVAFEDSLRNDAELRALVCDLREAAGDLGRSVSAKRPPTELKRRVLREIALEKQAHSPRLTTAAANWLPWAIAAAFIALCSILVVDRTRLQRELAAARTTDSNAMLVTLASPNGEHPDAKVTVAWQPDRQSGIITIANMPPPGPGRDYQLWAIDANHKDPISAGIIHIDPNGVARVRFKPDEAVSEIKAFAISIEREGGATKPEGPIVMIGNA